MDTKKASRPRSPAAERFAYQPTRARPKSTIKKAQISRAKRSAA